MKRICVIDAPGLSRSLLPYVPKDSRLGRWLSDQPVADLRPTWPAVTCSVQATLTTGCVPSEHGIVANGMAMYTSEADRALIDSSHFAEYRRNVSFWEQSNQYLECPRFWQNRDGSSRYKTALLFFQQSMPGFAGKLRPAADIVITPKPDHGPDGKLTSLCWSQPAHLVPSLFENFGPFPLMNYWGPMANIRSSEWIAKAAAWIWQNETPTLQFTYVPHLDYDLQRFGPESAQALQAVIDLANALDPLLMAIEQSGSRLFILSEYAIHSVTRSIQPNRILRDAGLLTVRNCEIDFAASAAFFLADHQVGYLFGAEQAKPFLVKAGLEEMGAVDARHRRSGIAAFQSPLDAWLDYRWWADEKDAPNFAGAVDIHRKPGYDPLELFFDPIRKKISNEAALIRGSHGRVSNGEGVLIGAVTEQVKGEDVARLIRYELE